MLPVSVPVPFFGGKSSISCVWVVVTMGSSVLLCQSASLSSWAHDSFKQKKDFQEKVEGFFFSCRVTEVKEMRATQTVGLHFSFIFCYK